MKICISDFERVAELISHTAEYALRAAVYLGAATEPARPAREISRATRIPTSYLTKILGSLTRARIVRSQRGPHGGFALAKPAEELTLLDVIRAVEPWRGIDRCPLGARAHAGRLCALHHRLAAAHRTLEDAFKATTLRDLIATPEGRDCPFPRREQP